MNEKEVIEMLDERITNDYVVLEGDEDTLYIKSRKSGKHFSIKVQECDD